VVEQVGWVGLLDQLLLVVVAEEELDTHQENLDTEVLHSD
jgi:hypothetical protein